MTRMTTTHGILVSLAGRYAKALFDLSQEQGQIEDVQKGLKALEKQIHSSDILAKALTNPTLQRTQQAAVLEDVCRHMNTPRVLQDFIIHLAKVRRLESLPKIREIFQVLSSQIKGEQVIEIISAHALTPAQQRGLKSKLSQAFPGSLAMTFVHRPKILGGVMIRAGSRVVDATLATQLTQLATVMKGAAP